ncbi:MAG: hypothetical protein EO766_12075 [Hydrotalea sp. AMD]|uniref:hypothetical protein n=1 Tax=Hydrotalea sp. AMD TaxID=2501297 RepID=UPI0010286932|nr:hypothetical protein [Hydrotalea sp. AMD]RWZ87255.1 MAG: hypothetical protein EO766_12075 [Hydrotalea sp. AMD]
MKLPLMSWSDRFALIDAYQPDDQTICRTFNLTMSELQTAKALKQSGTFTPNRSFDVNKYQHVFDNESITFRDITPPNRFENVDVYSMSPQTATKRSLLPKEPKKRGRKGNKINDALLAVTTTPEPAEEFAIKHNVSVAVLRQAKRFIDTMDKETAAKIGKVIVKQDKTTKQLMIWREDI